MSRIAVIAGDGIGREVIPAGIGVVKKAAAQCGMQVEFVEFPWGCEFYRKHGRMMEADGFDRLQEFDAIYLGAIGDPSVPDHIAVWQLLLPIRQRFDLYVNLR
ncbi:MAG TPA: isocitrate/isopropylmalate family dehydrogenase, partial [Vicinamibacterales bacterium]